MTVKKAMSVRAYVYTVSFLVLAVAIFGAVIYSVTAREMKEQLGNRALGIASTVAAMLEEKPAEYR
ncbi:MAG: hypothetical protein LBG05_06155, partial [Treponema sp.]|nr:hypothetical protein [Treponema sp.]